VTCYEDAINWCPCGYYRQYFVCLF